MRIHNNGKLNELHFIGFGDTTQFLVQVTATIFSSDSHMALKGTAKCCPYKKKLYLNSTRV